MTAVPSDSAPWRKALSECVTALVEQHGGPSAVGDKVGAHRTTIHRWMNGDADIENLGVLADKLGVRIAVTFGPEIQIEAAPPWAERLEAKVDQLVIGAVVNPVHRLALRGLVSRLGVLPKPSAEGFGDLLDTEDPGTAKREGQGAS